MRIRYNVAIVTAQSVQSQSLNCRLEIDSTGSNAVAQQTSRIVVQNVNHFIGIAEENVKTIVSIVSSVRDLDDSIDRTAKSDDVTIISSTAGRLNITFSNGTHMDQVVSAQTVNRQ